MAASASPAFDFLMPAACNPVVVARAVIWLPVLRGDLQLIRQGGGPFLPGKMPLLGQSHGQGERGGLPRLGENRAAIIARNARQSRQILSQRSYIMRAQDNRPTYQCRWCRVDRPARPTIRVPRTVPNTRAVAFHQEIVRSCPETRRRRDPDRPFRPCRAHSGAGGGDPPGLCFAHARVCPPDNQPAPRHPPPPAPPSTIT